ncbi:7575_t:CDS:2 [Scutellospora calospora]|uniref:7575_t:CDS:1 n=1 Tax=Scutellospora calospora TaxID=85575 RepID=A0ACA9KCG2_9GLOM|nr:7575_t:CDS:2 [Scutellospora calospora]
MNIPNSFVHELRLNGTIKKPFLSSEVAETMQGLKLTGSAAAKDLIIRFKDLRPL